METTYSRRKRGGKGLALIVLSLLMVGCNSAQTGALLGSAIGAAAGAGIDYRDRGRGALIGAGVGAVSGYLIGNEVDKSQQYPQYGSASSGYSGGYSGSPGYHTGGTTYVESHYTHAPPPRVYYSEHHHYRRYHYPSHCDW